LTTINSKTGFTACSGMYFDNVSLIKKKDQGVDEDTSNTLPL
jgi:hypothetical protein